MTNQAFVASRAAVRRGRMLIVAAALLWSTSGFFSKVLTKPTFLHLDEPPLEPFTLGEWELPIQMACYRVLFAGLALVPTLRPGQLTLRPMMFASVAAFAGMNALFVTALALGSAANALLLQSSAPLWMALVSVFWLGETLSRRTVVCLAFGLLGIAIIAVGGWQEGNPAVIAIALTSGVCYAGVVLSLRLMRDVPANWLTVWNLVLSGLVLLPFALSVTPPTPAQFATLVIFGAVQLGLAYWLMTLGLHTVSAPEAGTISLLEPILSPVWAYLVAGELPGTPTFVGGAIILTALAWRYWPTRAATPDLR